MRADEGDSPRAALLARRKAAATRWPGRGSEYLAELAAVAHELDQLARTLDGSDVEPIERLRTWCLTGETYLMLGQQRALESAAEAFRAAEEVALRTQATAHELMQLNHSYGLALLRLANNTNAELAAQAATRLSSALSLARKHMPVGIASIKQELFRAEHTVTQLRGPRRAERRPPVAERETEAA